MLIEQISVFIENQPGKLSEVTDILAQHQIDISALSLADTSDFGILRLIVDKPELAHQVLTEQGMVVKQTRVLAVSMADRPGGLAGVLRRITDSGLSIEYMYAFVGKQDGKAVVVMRVNNPEAALEALSKADGAVGNPRDIYRL